MGQIVLPSEDKFAVQAVYLEFGALRVVMVSYLVPSWQVLVAEIAESMSKLVIFVARI